MAILDLDLEGHPFYSNGDLYQDTSRYKTAPSSLRSASHSAPYDYAYADYDTDFSMASKPFCLDFWINLPGDQHYLGILPADWMDWSGGYYGWSLYYNLTDQHCWEFIWTNTNDDTGYIQFSPSTVYGAGWVHIALTNQYTPGSNFLRLFQNGHILGTLDSDTGYEITDPSVGTTFKLGVSFTSSETAPYYNIDNVRLTTGWHRWDSDFTPPTGTYDTDGFTVFLLQKDKEEEGGVYGGALGAVDVEWTKDTTTTETPTWNTATNTDRCDTGWYNSTPEPIPTSLWDASRPTPILIFCNDTDLIYSDTTTLSVSGGSAPYTWYVTAGTGTISADSTTVSADYTSGTEEDTPLVSCLDFFEEYDDQELTVAQEGLFPPKGLEIWAWYKCDEGAGDTLYNSALSSVTFDPLPDIVAMPGSACTWVDGYCYMNNKCRMSATPTDSPTFNEPLTLGGFLKRDANLWSFSEYDKVAWAMRESEGGANFLGLWANYSVWATAGGYGKGVEWCESCRPDIQASVGPWASGGAAGRWFFAFNVVTSGGTPGESDFRWYTTSYAVVDDGTLSAGATVADFEGTDDTYYRVIVGASNSTPTDLYSWEGNIGDIVVYVPGSFPTLEDWAIWYDELRSSYNMEARVGWP